MGAAVTSSFNGWGNSWAQTWDRISDPNAMYGSASMTFMALGSLTSTSAAGKPVGKPRFYAQPIPMADNSRQLREDDSLLLLLL